MKNILKLIAFLFLNLSFCQTIVPIENADTYFATRTYHNKYFKDVNGHLNKFLGQWKFENSVDKVEISIFKRDSIDSGNCYIDKLEIKCKYTKNGFVEFDTHLPNSTNKIYGGTFRDISNVNKYRFLYSEPNFSPLNKYYLNIEYIGMSSTGLPQLLWSTYFDPVEYEPNPVRLPLNMVFTKVL